MSINPLFSSSSNHSQVINQLNRVVQNFNNEQITKSFNSPGGTPGVVFGRLPNGKYGMLVYEDGVARVLIGESPDGTYGMWVSKEGYDVIEDVFS